MVELADTLDLGSSAERREGSNPSSGINIELISLKIKLEKLLTKC